MLHANMCSCSLVTFKNGILRKAVGSREVTEDP